MPQRSGCKKRKEKKVRKEKESKGQQYVNQYFKKQGGFVSGSCGGKLWNINFVHGL